MVALSGCSAVGSAPALGAGCRRFESCHSDQTLEIIEISRVLLFYGSFSARLPLLNFLKEVGCAKMARKRIKMNASTMTLAEVFPRFLASKTAQGVSEKTLKTYRWHFHCIGKHLDLGMSFDDLTREHLELLVVSMRRSGLSHNSISSYMRVIPLCVYRIPNGGQRPVLKRQSQHTGFSSLLESLFRSGMLQCLCV